MKYLCPCCNMRTLDEEPPGTYEICPVCGWEDDEVQFNNPNYSGGANEVSLVEAKKNFQTIGAIDKKSLEYVRHPTQEEIPE